MVHIVKEYDERKNEFLDTAMGLFMTQGYEQTSVAAIIQAVGVSKGAFYHYFKTKEDLLDQLSARATDQAMVAIHSILQDPDLSAIERLNAIFTTTNAYKAENRDLVMTLLQVFYSDTNLILRYRLLEHNLQVLSPVIAEILHQGNAQGSMSVDYPEETAVFILRIGASLVEGIAKQLPLDPEDTEGVAGVLRHLNMYNQAVERIIGAEPGSLGLVDESIIRVVTGQS